MGCQNKSWQDIESVLGLFAEDKGMTRRRYREFVRNGEQGKRPDLIGGRLIRSQGGCAAVAASNQDMLTHNAPFGI